MSLSLFLFFFSSRRRHTRSLCDWSSDVCSSDLHPRAPRRFKVFQARRYGFALFPQRRPRKETGRRTESGACPGIVFHRLDRKSVVVGKECRSPWSTDHIKKKKESTDSSRPRGIR